MDKDDECGGDDDNEEGRLGDIEDCIALSAISKRASDAKDGEADVDEDEVDDDDDDDSDVGLVSFPTEEGTFDFDEDGAPFILLLLFLRVSKGLILPPL